MIPQFQSKKENQLQFKLCGYVGCIHRTFSSLSPPNPQGFMLNGTNHIRGSALFGTAACSGALKIYCLFILQ